MAVFTAGELFDIAVGIERNGVAYYDSLAQLSGDAGLKRTYEQLAQMERRHVGQFQKMRASAGSSGPVVPGPDEPEYGEYLRALIDSSVFTDDKVARDLAKRAAGPAEALQLALGAEKDSVLFYSAMRDLVPQSERAAVDSIIGEERQHIRDLSDLKRRYSK
ncbi:MAG: ferritin family protein [Dehalococcoidia bacterium]|jgi:rubrerythrin|nr:ferritin family protein [Dehalococcoidia bacterium]